MMRRLDWNKWIEILRTAYWEKENIPIGSAWQEETMRRIRALASEGRQSFTMMFEQFVWRLAPVTFAMILIISIVLSSYELIGEVEVFRLFSYELEDSYALLLLE